MPRVVSLFLPSWSTDRLRRKLGDVSPPPDRPLVLVGRQGNRRLVAATDRAAMEAGLRVGMPATKAQALVQGLAVMDAEPDADAEALERLALWALRRYAPIVAVDPPDGLVMDTTGATVRRIQLMNAWPYKWEGPDLKAGDTASATEKVTVTFEDISIE